MKLKVKIKIKISSLIESITNKKCENCKYNYLIFCKRVDKKGIKCREKLYPYGFELKGQNK